MKSKFERIATYRNGIAPAYTYDCKWIFIDKEQNRVGKYEYATMDPVLRHGLYLVANEQHLYNFCKVGGEPILFEWYDRLEKFDNGYSIFWKGIRDDNGELVIFDGGQPSYFWGVVDTLGNYVIAPNYTEIRWADDKKEYWYAEKNGAKYFLYPDGRRFLIMSTGLCELSKDDVYGPPRKIPKRKKTAKQTVQVFDEVKFMTDLVGWLYKNEDNLKFYYRDCDLDFEVKKVYPNGTLIRAGKYLEITDKLQRPIHNTRFVIASNHVTSVKQVHEFNEVNRPLSIDFKDNFLHFNSCFLVLNVIKYIGVTQVLLLHIPQAVIRLALKFNCLKFMEKHLVADCIRETLDAENDLIEKMNGPVHGYSLSTDWQKRMEYPIGMGDDRQLLSLEPASEEEFSEAERVLSAYTLTLTDDSEYNWNEKYYVKN